VRRHPYANCRLNLSFCCSSRPATNLEEQWLAILMKMLSCFTRSPRKAVECTWAMGQAGQKQKPIVLNLCKKEKRKSTVGEVKNLYIEMLENMSEEERSQHELQAVENEPDPDQSIGS